MDKKSSSKLPLRNVPKKYPQNCPRNCLRNCPHCVLGQRSRHLSSDRHRLQVLCLPTSRNVGHCALLTTHRSTSLAEYHNWFKFIRKCHSCFYESVNFTRSLFLHVTSLCPCEIVVEIILTRNNITCAKIVTILSNLPHCDTPFLSHPAPSVLLKNIVVNFYYSIKIKPRKNDIIQIKDTFFTFKSRKRIQVR